MTVPTRSPGAPTFYRRLYEDLLRTHGPRSPYTAEALHRYGWTFHNRGDYERAAETFRRALEVRLAGAGEVAQPTFWTMCELTRMLLAGGAHATAWPEAAHFWSVMARALNPDADNLRWQTRQFLAICAKTGDWSRAAAFFRGEADALRRSFGPDHLRTRHALALLALALAKDGQAAEARTVAGVLLDAAGPAPTGAEAVVADRAREALDLARASASPPPPEPRLDPVPAPAPASVSGPASFRLGLTFGRRGDWRRAAAYLRRATEDDRAAFVRSSAAADYFTGWFYLAPLYVELGDRAAYRRHRRLMLERFADATEPGVLERGAQGLPAAARLAGGGRAAPRDGPGRARGERAGQPVPRLV